MIVRAAPVEHYGWILQRIGLAPTGRFRAIEALDPRTGEIRGMVGYDGWTHNAVQMHIALASAAALRPLLRPAFAYPFHEIGLGVVLAPVVASNARSLALVAHAGFTEVCRIRDGAELGVDMVLHEMRREHCRYLGER
jgi:RimJ/RimL family protein N-acetyltransferase